MSSESREVPAPILSAESHTRDAPSVFQDPAFEPLPLAVKILLAPRIQREDQVSELRELAETLDKDANAISNLYWEGFNRSIKNYSQILSDMESARDGSLKMQVSLSQAIFQPIESDSGNQLGLTPISSGPQAQIPSGDGYSGKLGYLWSKELECTYTLEILNKIRQMRDCIPAVEEFSEAGYFLHAASVIKHTLGIVDEIEDYNFFGTNRLCSDIRLLRIETAEKICEQLNVLIFKRQGNSRLETFEPEAATAAAAADGNGDGEAGEDIVSGFVTTKSGRLVEPSKKTLLDSGFSSTVSEETIIKLSEDAVDEVKGEAFKLSFQPVGGVNAEDTKDEDLCFPPARDVKKAIWNYVHALELLDYVPDAATQLMKRIPEEITTLFKLSDISYSFASHEIPHFDSSLMPKSKFFSHDLQSGASSGKTSERMLVDTTYGNGDGLSLEQMFEKCVDVMNNYKIIDEAIGFFYHPSSTSSLTKTNATGSSTLERPFSIEKAWDSMQNTILSILKPFLYSKNKDENGTKRVSSESSSHLFSFNQAFISREEGDATVGQGNSSESHSLDSQIPLYVSQQNIVMLHPIVHVFNEVILDLFSKKQYKLSSSLLSYMNSYVNDVYLPEMGSYLQETANAILQNPQPDSASPVPDVTHRILDSAIAIQNLTRLVCHDIFALPLFCDELLVLLNIVFTKYLAHCDQLLSSKKVPGSFNGGIPIGSESLSLSLMSKNQNTIPAFFRADPLWSPVGSTISLNADKSSTKTQIPDRIQKFRTLGMTSSMKGGSTTSKVTETVDKIEKSLRHVMSLSSMRSTGAPSSIHGLIPGAYDSLKQSSRAGIPSSNSIIMSSRRADGLSSARSAAGQSPSLSFVDDIRRFYPDALDKLNREIRPNELVLDVRRLAILADIHTSLEWLVCELKDMLSLISETMQGVNESATGNVTISPSGQLTRKTINVNAKEQEHGKLKTSKASTPVSEQQATTERGTPRPDISYLLVSSSAAKVLISPLQILSDKFEGLITKCVTVCENALFILRLEIKLHCVFYMARCRKTLYFCDASESFPDQCVVELNKHLVSLEELVYSRLVPERVTFVVDGVAPLICSMMLGNARALTRVNQAGIKKLLRDLFTVQQNLAVTVYHKEHFFDHVRRYYELMSITDYHDLYRAIAQNMAENTAVGGGTVQNKPLFTMEQYDILLSLLAPNHKVSAVITQSFHNLLLGIDDGGLPPDAK